MAVHHTAPSPESEPSAQQLADLVSANHILYDQQVVDAFGHVSVRHDRRPDRFLLARNMAPGLVGPDDILQFNLSGEPEDDQGRRVYLERFLHAGIYRHWPQVQAIVHSHSSTIVPLTVVPGVSLRAVSHMAGFIGTSAPVFDIRDVAGHDTNLLISDSRLGAAFAAQFTGNDIVLMRGHGSTVVADSLQKVVFRAIYAERNARIQSAAMGMGEVRYLSVGECAACRDSHEAQADRPWALWKDEALRSRAPRE